MFLFYPPSFPLPLSLFTPLVSKGVASEEDDSFSPFSLSLERKEDLSGLFILILIILLAFENSGDGFLVRKGKSPKTLVINYLSIILIPCILTSAPTGLSLPPPLLNINSCANNAVWGGVGQEKEIELRFFVYNSFDSIPASRGCIGLRIPPLPLGI